MTRLPVWLLVLASCSAESAATDPDSDAEADSQAVDVAPIPDVPPAPVDSFVPDVFLDPAGQAALCEEYCGIADVCAEPVAPPDCTGDCLGRIAADPNWTLSFTCALHATCPNRPRCLEAPAPAETRCEELCDRASQCDLFPSAALGRTRSACGAFCAVDLRADPVTTGAFLDCATEALETGCSDASLVTCRTPAESQCVRFCRSGGDPAVGGSCDLLPDGFESAEACSSACLGWSPAQRYTAGVCVARFGCTGGTAACTLPRVTPGLDTPCCALWGLCGGLPGYGLPKDPTLCAWVLDGQLAEAPPIDPSAALACVAGFASCPTPPAALYGCFYPDHPPCLPYCQARAACEPGLDVAVCRAECQRSRAFAPAATDTVIGCTQSAVDCAAVAACVSGPGS